MELKANDITLEKVKNSNYWDLIAIIVWNHYSEEQYQDESNIDIKERWYGLGNACSHHSSEWDNPDFTLERFTRTLKAIVITFTRNDYITYIYIGTDGNIYSFGRYTDIENSKSPNYSGAQRNLEITNWMIKNNLITVDHAIKK